MPPNITATEIEKFSHLAQHWWDISGDLKTLHAINPLRMEFIQQCTSLSGKSILDVGCGGGILSESLALHAHVTGIDASSEVIAVAKQHAETADLPYSIDYQVTTVEELATHKPASFDVITCMELLEHVPDPASILKSCASLLKPQGHLFISTLNRTLKSYLFAIIGAEYALRLLPIGTHDYGQFIRPSELDAWARPVHLALKQLRGITYDPLRDKYGFTRDLQVNYLAHYQVQNHD